MIKKMFSYKSLLCILLVIIFLLGIGGISAEAQGNRLAVVNLLAVDSDGEKIEVAVNIITPSSGGKTTKTFSGSGKTISKALENVSVQLGKDIGLAHCDVMAVGDNLCNEGILKVLDFFTRTKKVGRNAKLLNFNKEPFKFLEAMTYLNETLNLEIAEIISYNKDSLDASESNIEAFYSGYYSDIGVTIMPKVEITTDQKLNAIKVKASGENSSSNSGNEGSTSSGGGSSAGGSASSSDELYFVNDGTTSVFKQGIKEFEVSSVDMSKINILHTGSRSGNFILHNVTDELYNNADVSILMENKKLEVDTSFKGNVPVLKVNMQAFCTIEEVVENGKNDKFLTNYSNFLNKIIRNLLEEKIKTDIITAFEYLKNMEFETLNIYSKFNKYHYKKWIKYLSTVDYYLDGVQLEVTVLVIDNA